MFELLEQGFAWFPVGSDVTAEHDGSGYGCSSVGEGVMGVEDGLPGGEGVVYEQNTLVSEVRGDDVTVVVGIVAEWVGLPSEPSELADDSPGCVPSPRSDCSNPVYGSAEAGV